MTIQYATGPERKRLAAAAAEIIGAKAAYAGMPTARYNVGPYIVTRDWALTGPDDRGLVAALAQQDFKPVEESYDAQSDQPERLTIEVSIDESFTQAKMENLKKLVASRKSLLKKVLGAEALPIGQTENSLLFSWFPVDENAVVYGQLACALVRTATAATRITARERPFESEKFRMRTFLLRLNFIGDTYKQARKILTHGLSGSGSYAKGKASSYDEGGINSADETSADTKLLHAVNQSMGADGAGMNSLDELMADEEMIRAVNRSFEQDKEET